MKYYFAKENINPLKPAYCVGFAVEKEKTVKTKLDLYMRLLLLEDKDTSVLLMTLDNLCVSIDVYRQFAQVCKKKLPNTYLIITCSHTHYAPSLANEQPMNVCDEVYKNQVLLQFDCQLDKIELKEIDGYVDYHQTPFNQVGSTRISKKSDENVYGGVLSIYDGKTRLGNIVFYNCHPTEDVKDPKYFSSAYVGAGLQMLQESYPNEFFMFVQGSDGDVSSRFTRKERSFEQTMVFGKLMSKCWSELLQRNQSKEKLVLSYKYQQYAFKAQFKEIPVIEQAYLDSLKEAERKELLIGLEELKKYQKMVKPTINELYLSRVSLGKYRLFFSPFELFTEYNSYIDKNTTLLIGYSNGALAYLLPVDNDEISYEYFLETTTNEDKRIVVEQIKNL